MGSFSKAVGTAVLLLAIGRLPCQTTPLAVPLPAEGSVASIHVDLDRRIGQLPPTYAWFGYDEANYTTMPGGRQLLGELHNLSPVPVTIRAHHLLTSGRGEADVELKWSSTDIYHEDATGKPHYSFTILDQIFDAYRDAGVRPMVELGFMPHDLAGEASPPRPHQPYQVHYPKSTVAGASNNPPRDYGRWRDLVRAVTAHLVARYGRDTVLGWYFEVWNEPDIDYWHASAQDYWKLYDYAVDGVRAALPGARVGGPASTGPGNAHAADFLRGFLTHIAKDPSAANGKALPLDFISFHAKGTPHIEQGHVTLGLAHELTDADAGFRIVAGYPRFQKLPIILSEADPEGCAACSSKVNPANNYRNGTLYPAYTAAAYKALLDLAERDHVNLIGMLSWSFEFEGKEYFEGFRSLSTNGVDKPVLNFFRMAGLMRGQRVRVESDAAPQLPALVASGVPSRPDLDALAACDQHEATVMLWNYRDATENAPAAEASLRLSGLPTEAHRVLVTRYRIDDTHSNAYTVWKALGSPQHPTVDQLAQLHAAAGLQLLTSPQWMDAPGGQLALKTQLPGESLELVQVQW